MVDSKLINKSVICFSGDPKLMKSYLKKLGYKISKVVKKQDYVLDKHTMTIDVSPRDRHVFAFLRAHYTQVPQENAWIEKPKRRLLVKVADDKKKPLRKPFPKNNSLIITIQILQYVGLYDDVIRLLCQLSHSARSYVVSKADDLSSWLVTHPNNITQKEFEYLGEETKSHFKEI